MKKIHGQSFKLYPLFLTLLFFLSSATLNNRFEEVLKNIKEKSIRQQLIAFEKGGIEKAVDITSYNTEEVISYAKTFIGTKHKMRGTSKSGIDCSGLVMVTHQQFGIHLPHSAQEQARYGKIVPEMSELEPGDLVFFCQSYAAGRVITHSGIYMGDKHFIHASNDHGVIVSNIEDPYYWKKKFLFGTRFK